MDREGRAQTTLVAGAGARAAPGRPGGRRPLLLGLVGVGAVLVATVTVAASSVGGPTVGERATDVDEAVAATGAVLDRWYERELAALDLRWTPVGARLTDGDGTVDCDGAGIVVDDTLRSNAYATVCEEGPVVAFDPDRFPAHDVATQIVLAHEWAHVFQMRNPEVDLPSLDAGHHPAERELQADCLAGAWAAEHVVGEFHGLMLSNIGGFGDPRWVAVDDERGHGTATERTSAYDRGVAGGIPACLPPAFDPR